MKEILTMKCWSFPFYTPLSFRRSVLWWHGLFLLKKFLKPLCTSVLFDCRPVVTSAALAGLLRLQHGQSNRPVVVFAADGGARLKGLSSLLFHVGYQSKMWRVPSDSSPSQHSFPLPSSDGPWRLCPVKFQHVYVIWQYVQRANRL